MGSMIQNLYDSIPLWGVYSIVHDNIHIKDIHILLRKIKSSKREMNGTSAWHTKLRLSQFILSSTVFMKFSFSFSLVKVLHRMFYSILSVQFSTFPCLRLQIHPHKHLLSLVLFSSPPQINASKFIFPILFLFFFNWFFDIFYFIFHFYYKYFNWIIIKTSWSTLKHFRYFLL